MNIPLGHIGQSAKATANAASAQSGPVTPEKEAAAPKEAQRPKREHIEFAALFAGMPDAAANSKHVEESRKVMTASDAEGGSVAGSADPAAVAQHPKPSQVAQGAQGAVSSRPIALNQTGGTEQQTAPHRNARALAEGSSIPASRGAGAAAQPGQSHTVHAALPQPMQAPSLADSEGTKTLEKNAADSAAFSQKRNAKSLSTPTVAAKNTTEQSADFIRGDLPWQSPFETKVDVGTKYGPDIEARTADAALPAKSETKPLLTVPSAAADGVPVAKHQNSAHQIGVIDATSDPSARQSVQRNHTASSFAQIVGQTFLPPATDSGGKSAVTVEEAAPVDRAPLPRTAKSEAPMETRQQRVAAEVSVQRDPNQITTPFTSTPVPQTSALSGLSSPKIGTGSFTRDIQSKIEGAHSLLASSDMPEILNWDPARAAMPATTTTGLRADLAPHVARQLVDVMAQAAHRPTEIALSPQELGRVRMSVVAEDGAITVNIIAERPETLDLMRRHIDQLGQTFKSMGYESINFAFGQGADSGDQAGAGPESGQSGADTTPNVQQAAAAPDEPAIIQLDAAHMRGVDVRL